ncbi:MAG: CinA family protein [Nocardioidaceae bacterium]
MTGTEPARRTSEATETAHAIAGLAQERGVTITAAESLTSGTIACHLGEAPASATWFRGAIVAYTDEVKFDVLGVRRGPVVSAESAGQMALGAVRLMHADWAVAVTGSGGPGMAEEQPPGTVFMAVAHGDAVHVEQHRFGGEPGEVLERTTLAALRMLHDRIDLAAGRV